MIEFSRDEKAALVAKIQRYFEDAFGEPIGGFDAEFLLDFFLREIGPPLYNQALADARALLAARFDALADELVLLEKDPPRDADG